MSANSGSIPVKFGDTVENAELDDAFAKINSYLFATSNTLVRNLMIKNLEELSKEAIKRDSSLTFKLKQYILQVKGIFK